MEAVIDTNALVYDFIEDPHFHEQASKALDDADRWLVPSVALEEFVFVMWKVKLGHELIEKKILELVDDRRMMLAPVTSVDVKSALRLLSSEKASLSRFNDEVILSLARRKKAPLLTFDMQLRAQSRRFGVEILGASPDEEKITRSKL